MTWPDIPKGGPDEAHDVIVKYVRIHEVPAGERHDSWTVWVGSEQHRSFTDKAEAIRIAVQVAKDRGGLAWLQDESGYPLKCLG